MRGIDPGRTNAAPGPGVYSTPQEAWSYQVKGIIRTSPLVVDGVVYFGQSADSPASPGSILAVRASDGSLIWTLPTQHGLTATFLLDDDILYAVDDNGVIYAVDAQTGTEVWSESLRDDQPYSLTWYGAPLISSGTLVFSTGSLLGVAASNDAVFVARPADEWIEGDPHVYGISPSDGSILWDVSGFPGQSSQSLFALSVTDGSLLWSHAGPPAYLGPAYSDGVVYYGEIGPTALVALDSETGAQRWRTVLTEGKAWDGTSSPAVADGAVLVGLNSTASGTLVSVDKSTGAEQWRVPLFSGSQYLSMQSGIAVVGEEAIALGNGAIAGVDLSSRAVLWHVVLSIEMMMQPMPVVADGTILQVTLDPSNEHGAIVALTTPPDSS